MAVEGIYVPDKHGKQEFLQAQISVQSLPFQTCSVTEVHKVLLANADTVLQENQTVHFLTGDVVES